MNQENVLSRNEAGLSRAELLLVIIFVVSYAAYVWTMIGLYGGI